MANGGEITFDVKVTGYWQTCPVCGGRGQVAPDFYAGVGFTTSTAPEGCRRCHRTGTIAVPVTQNGGSDAE